MPRKIHPRRGWRYPSFRFGVPDDDLKAQYPDAFFEEIARDYGVPDDLLAKLKACVLHAGAVYKQFKTLRQESPQRMEVAAALLDLRQDLERISRKWDLIDDVSWQRIWRTEQDLQEQCLWGDSRDMTDIGAMWDIGDDEKGMCTLDDLPPVMRLVLLVLDRATTGMPNTKRGQKRQEPVRYWAKPLLDFWESDLGRKVTYQHFGGEPVTETHCFLYALLKRLDESATRYLGTVLEEERTARKHR